jgi:hypothetical protein
MCSCVRSGNEMPLNKIVAALLALFFVLFTLLVIITWSVGESILDADAYVNALAEAGFFEVPYQLIREGTIPGPGGVLLREGPLSAVSGVALEAVARELAPPHWLRTQMEQAVRDFIAVTEEPKLDELPDLVISLSEVKARALGEPGDRALATVIEALPACSPAQLPFELSRDKPICKPAGLDLNPFLSELKALLAPLVRRVPDTYRVSWQPEQRDVIEDLQRAGQLLKKLQFALLLLAALNMALLGLIWVLAVRAPAEWLRWTGVPLLLLGLLTLLAALLIPGIVAWGLDNNAVLAEGDLPVALTQSLEQAIRDYSLLAFRPTRLVGLVLVVVGMLLTLISPLFPGRQQPASQIHARPMA